LRIHREKEVSEVLLFCHIEGTRSLVFNTKFYGFKPLVYIRQVEQMIPFHTSAGELRISPSWFKQL